MTPPAGFGDRAVDVAVAWLPLADTENLRSRVVATERSMLAVSTTHRLAGRRNVAMIDLLDEPFVALPASAGAPREHWLATDHRQGRPPVIGAVARSADEAFEAVANCQGVALVAEGNAAMYQRDGIVTIPVTGLPPNELALAWRAAGSNPAVRDFVDAATELHSHDPQDTDH